MNRGEEKKKYLFKGKFFIILVQKQVIGIYVSRACHNKEKEKQGTYLFLFFALYLEINRR
jgi:hypothetical protein